MSFQTKDDTTDQEIKIYPITDAHMHIQGNQIAPIPIMKGVLFVQLSTMLCEELLNGQINFQELSYLKNEDTNLLEIKEKGLFLNSLLGDLVNNQTPILDLVVLENRKNLLDILGSEKLTSMVADYGKIAKFSSLDASKLYIIDKKDENIDENIELISIGYPSHKKSYTKFYNKNEYENGTKDLKELEAKSVTNHFDSFAENYFKGTQVGKFQFSIMHGMELMYAHYWGAVGIPIYVFNDKGELFYITNSMYYYNSNNDRPIFAYNIYDCTDEDLQKYRIRIKKTEEQKKYPNYIHFLKKVKDVEIYQFEDHEQHVAMQKLAALKEPLHMLPFYHFDFRRFFSPTEGITKNHYFFNYRNKKQYDSNQLYNQFSHTQQSSYKRSKFLFKKEDILGFKLKINFETIKQFFVSSEKNTTNPDSLFWGIKMYVALGYPPYYLLDVELTKRVFPMLKDVDLQEAHNEVEKFYRFCIENDIPITCHGSPQGMTIADPGVYLKEYLKLSSLLPDYLAAYKKSTYISNSESIMTPSFPVVPQSFLTGLGLIDDFSSPKSWEKVLSYNGLGKLRLCIAHFGGGRFFDGTFSTKTSDEKNLYQWNDDIVDLITQYNNVYTDISCFTFKVDKNAAKEIKRDKNKSIKEEISTIKNNIENFDENSPKDISYRIYKTADNLAKRLRNDKSGRLRERIMFGTDWPMFETNEVMDKYKGNIFFVLQLVTAMLDNEWDAWHQFSVINPLLFLGLIEKGEKGYVFSDKGKNKIENYYNSLTKYTPNKIKELFEKCHISTDKTQDVISGYSQLDAEYEYISVKWFNENYYIPFAEDILLEGNNKCLKITEYERGEKWQNL